MSLTLELWEVAEVYYRCPICGKYVPAREVKRHIRRHMKKLIEGTRKVGRGE